MWAEKNMCAEKKSKARKKNLHHKKIDAIYVLHHILLSGKNICDAIPFKKIPQYHYIVFIRKNTIYADFLFLIKVPRNKSSNEKKFKNS
jgi:hypothetical protein